MRWRCTLRKDRFYIRNKELYRFGKLVVCIAGVFVLVRWLVEETLPNNFESENNNLTDFIFIRSILQDQSKVGILFQTRVSLLVYSFGRDVTFLYHKFTLESSYIKFIIFLNLGLSIII